MFYYSQEKKQKGENEVRGMNLVASFPDCLNWEQGYKTFSRSQSLDTESTLMMGYYSHLPELPLVTT